MRRAILVALIVALFHAEIGSYLTMCCFAGTRRHERGERDREHARERDGRQLEPKLLASCPVAGNQGGTGSVAVATCGPSRA